MKTTTEILKELETVLFEKFPFTKDLFLPGITDAELDAFAEKEKLELPESIRTLYKWHGGSSSAIFNNMYLFPKLEQVSKIRKDLDDDEFMGSGYWSRSVLPVLCDKDGYDLLAIDLNGEVGGEKESILFWDRHYGFDSIVYDSLQHLLQTIIEKSKTIFVLGKDENGITIKTDNQGGEIPQLYSTSEEGKKIDEQINPGYPKTLI